MSYQGPMMIREPALRWPVLLVAGLATALVVLLTACVISLALTRPAAAPAAKPRLVGALRPEMPGFERYREKIIVEQLTAKEARRPSEDSAVEMTATVRNATGRTLTGLGMRGGIVDARTSSVRDREVVIIPARQTVLEPGEAIGVTILLEGVSPGAERAGVLMEVTALSVE